MLQKRVESYGRPTNRQKPNIIVVCTCKILYLKSVFWTS